MLRSHHFLRSFWIALLFAAGAAAQVQNSDCGLPVHPVRTAYLQAAYQAESKNQFLGAINSYIRILEVDPEDECVTNKVSELFGKMRYFSQQSLWANRALELNRGSTRAYINLGNAQYAMGDVEDAKRTYKKAAEVSPKDPLPYFRLGVLSDERRKYSEAISNYKRALEIDPNFEDALYNLSAVYADQKRFDEAKVLLEKLLALNPNAADARALLNKVR
jgi:superkiller protein 3